MAQFSRLSVIVPDKKLALIIEVLKGEYSELKIETVGAPAKTNGNGSNGNGHASTRILSEDAASIQSAMEFIKTIKQGEPFSTLPTGNLAAHLVKQGYKKTSVSPICTQLARLGKIKRSGRGKAVRNEKLI